MKRFKSTGVVLGNYWGGGKGSYIAREYTADTLEDLLDKNNKAFKDGSLDFGMGYESLIGALIEVSEITTIEVEGKPYTNTETSLHTIGKLTDDEYDFLLTISYD